MAYALTETVSQYIPTFEKVEAYNISSYQDGDGTEETLQHSLVLSIPDAEITSTRKTKKMDEAGIKSNRRILRTISKTFHLPANSSAKEQQQQQAALKRNLSRTISQHEINLDNKLRAFYASRPVKKVSQIKASSQKAFVVESNSLQASSTSLKSSSGAPKNIAALRAADRLTERRDSNAALKVLDRKAAAAVTQPLSRQSSVSSLKGSAGIKRQSLRTTLAQTTAQLNKNVAELAQSVDTPKTASPNFRGSVSSISSPVMSEKISAKISSPVVSTRISSPVVSRVKASTPVMSTLKSSAKIEKVSSPAMSVLSPAVSAKPRSVLSVLSPKTRSIPSDLLSPKLGSSNVLKSSAGIRRPSRSRSSSLKKSSDVMSSPRVLSPVIEASSDLRSPMQSPSLRSRRVPIGGKNDALDVLLHDFDTQHRRTHQLSKLEQEIYQSEVARFEELESKKKQQEEAAVLLANNITAHETKLTKLFCELEAKKKRYQCSEQELAAISKEFQAEVQQSVSEISGASSAAIRLQEAAARRSMKEQWSAKAGGDLYSQARYRLLMAEEDIRQTEANINAVKKELGRMKNTAGKSKSSDYRLREELRLREHMRETGQPKPRGQYVRPKGVPKNNEKRAHVSRLEAEKEKRQKVRAEKLKLKQKVADRMERKQSSSSSFRSGATSSLADSISSPASMRSRYSSPLRAGSAFGSP